MTCIVWRSQKAHWLMASNAKESCAFRPKAFEKNLALATVKKRGLGYQAHAGKCISGGMNTVPQRLSCTACNAWHSQKVQWHKALRSLPAYLILVGGQGESSFSAVQGLACGPLDQKRHSAKGTGDALVVKKRLVPSSIACDQALLALLAALGTH
jgi:hypothetical protein